MNERRCSSWMVLRAFLVAGVLTGTSAYSENKDITPFNIGYVELKNDKRYIPNRIYTKTFSNELPRPFDGAQLGLRDAKILGQTLKLKFVLEKIEGDSAEDLVKQIKQLRLEKNINFFLLDLPNNLLDIIALETRKLDLLLFNVSEPADRLQEGRCLPHLMHLLPSNRMLTDALVQHIIRQNWRNVLVLKGPFQQDTDFAEKFIESAKRFGAKITEVREFILSNNPRLRELNNIVLLTSGDDYDIIFLADTNGEFGRYVPYQTKYPRPIIGTEGLIPTAWHWSWERYGGPQLNSRFEKHNKRHMAASDWAAWVGVRTIVESLLRTKSTDFFTVVTYLKSKQMIIDGYKGNPMNFRSWNNQLRQPILLHTHNAVINRAPIKEFLHQTNTLDTLGIDQNNTECKF